MRDDFSYVLMLGEIEIALEQKCKGGHLIRGGMNLYSVSVMSFLSLFINSVGVDWHEWTTEGEIKMSFDPQNIASVNPLFY